jgi:hypothetical protein
MKMTAFVNFLEGHDPNEQIVLPHQSLLGIFEGLYDQPTGYWPITFLCLQHEHVFERSADTVQYGPVAGPGRRTRPTPIWVIDCGCAQGNCAAKKKVYAFGDEPRTDNQIKLCLLNAKPLFQCQGHQFVLDVARMTVTRLSDDSGGKGVNS